MARWYQAYGPGKPLGGIPMATKAELTMELPFPQLLCRVVYSEGGFLAFVDQQQARAARFVLAWIPLQGEPIWHDEDCN